MKRHFIFLIIGLLGLLIAGCGAGGGVSSLSDGLTGGNNDQSNNTTPPPSTKSKVAKIKINKDGIYRIAFSDLNTPYLDLSGISITSLKMTSNGDEIAIDVIETNNDGIFDEGDFIEFYGKAVSRGDKRFRYTETNVYLLSSEGGTGKRMEKVQGNSTSSQGASSFLKVLHKEQDTWYEQKNYPEVSKPQDVREHWFWGEVFYTPGLVGTNPADIKYYQRDYDFSTRNIDKTKPVLLKLRLQSVNGSHHIRGYINGAGSPIVNETWDSGDPYDVEVSVPVSSLNNGQNTLRLESVGGTLSGIYESFYLDWFDVSFYHKYQAEHDSLDFTGNGLINISDFTSKDISIYDISGYPDMKELTPDSIEDTGAGYKKAVFTAPDNQDSKFVALASSEKKKPLSVEAYQPADLRSKDGDYIIITHEDFYDAVKPLAEYRSNQGYKVLTVKMGDIYNEFSFGIETPEAIKAYLTDAYNKWTTKPKYILLVGDATIDYKDVSGYGKNNGVKSYLPAYLYNYPVLGEVPSDNWFADVDTTNGILPEMNIGRIPAKTAGDVAAVIDKIISHEKSINKSKNVLLVADDDLVFETLSDSIAGIIPNDYSVTKLYKKNVNAGEFRNSIIDGINSGAAILNYTGHGAVVDWTKEKAFSSEDTVSLKNKGDYPFVVALDCMNGYFVLPDDGVGGQSSSIAESFLLSQERGAVAVFAASSFGYPTDHALLAQELYGKIFEDGITLGEVVTKARETACNYGMDVDGSYRCNGINDDVVETFIFFGDPATRLK